ncbi:glycosyltransferase [Azospirillum doebereinerae]|uniref:glycosyltransferase family protein n=1 Tax=Azospirillum doebereinerae TaxID=92933 RepID=UPI00384E9154
MHRKSAPRRNRLLATVAAHAEHAGYNYHFCLSGDISILPSPLRDGCRPPVYGNAMLQGLRSARIAFDARGEITLGQPGLAGTIDLAGRQTANMRIFEATGCGAMLLTEPFDNLPEFFRAGYEVETYGSEEELIDKITYYTNHPEERDAIASRGQERCLKDHSLEQRAIGFDRLMRAALDGRFPKASGHQ